MSTIFSAFLKRQDLWLENDWLEPHVQDERTIGKFRKQYVRSRYGLHYCIWGKECRRDPFPFF